MFLEEQISFLELLCLFIVKPVERIPWPKVLIQFWRIFRIPEKIIKIWFRWKIINIAITFRIPWYENL